MNWIVKTVAILLVIDALTLLIKPTILKIMTTLTKGKNIYCLGIINILLGAILLLFVNTKCTSPTAVIIFGIIILALGLAILAMPDKTRKVFEWLMSKKPATIRVIATIYLLAAAALVYAS